MEAALEADVALLRSQLNAMPIWDPDLQVRLRQPVKLCISNVWKQFCSCDFPSFSSTCLQNSEGEKIETWRGEKRNCETLHFIIPFRMTKALGQR